MPAYGRGMGLPYVPPEFSETINDPAITPDLARPGMPRPRFRKVPIPASARVEPGELNIIESDPNQWRRVLEERLCVLCAEPIVREERAYLFVTPSEEDYWPARGALHHHCAVATSRWCVHIRERLADGRMTCGSLSGEQIWDTKIVRLSGPDASGVIGDYLVTTEALEAVEV